MQRDAHARASLAPAELVERLRNRTTTTNRPPAPVMAMLGEIVVHGADLRRPLGLPSTVGDDAALACLNMYKTASFPVGGKKRIGGYGSSPPTSTGPTAKARKCPAQRSH
jgi:hypothetical protein